jgi:hypothetical protein
MPALRREVSVKRLGCVVVFGHEHTRWSAPTHNRARAVVLALMLLPAAAVPTLATPLSLGSGLVYTYTSLPFFFVAGDYAGVVPALYPAPVTDDGTGDRITGSFVLSDSFVGEWVVGPQDITDGVVSYSFSDGHQTLTEDNSTATFRFIWGPDGPVVWDGLLGQGDSPHVEWFIEISSATGSIVSTMSGYDLFERASYNGTAPFCGGGGYDIDHGGTNGGTSCIGGLADRGVNTSQLSSWAWTVQPVGQPVADPGSSLLLLGIGLAGLRAGRKRWQ